MKRLLAAIFLWPLLLALLPSARADAPPDRSLPDQADLRPAFKKYGLAPKAQVKRDVCSLFAVTGAVEYELAKEKPDHPTRLSEEFLIWAANDAAGKRHDQAMFYEAVHGLRTLGVCSQSLMPYEKDEDPKRRPSKEAVADARSRRQWAAHWIKRWDAKTGLTDAQLTDIKGQLADGHPVAVGLRWPKQEKFSRDHVLDVPGPDQVFDGHSILFVGYRDDRGQPGGGLFLFRNSMGEKWQDGGYAAMPYAHAAAYGNDALSLRHDPDAGAAVRFEAKDLRIASASHCNTSTQDMKDFGAKMWSDGKQLFCRFEDGGSLTLEFPVEREGSYRVDLLATLAPDFGTCRIALDDKPLDALFDAYAGRVQPSGPCELGTFPLKAGKHRLEFTSAGKNVLSQGYLFGIDAMDLTAQK